MASNNALQAVLDKAKDTSPPAVEAPAKPAAETPAEAASTRRFHRPSRDNRRFIGGHFNPAVGKQLRMLAVEDDTTVQALLEEALDLLFVKKGRQKIADIANNNSRKRA